jgi:hypothetical protein
MIVKEYMGGNNFDIPCVVVENEDGSIWSGLKSAWDEMLKQAEQSTPNLTGE